MFGLGVALLGTVSSAHAAATNTEINIFNNPDLVSLDIGDLDRNGTADIAVGEGPTGGRVFAYTQTGVQGVFDTTLAGGFGQPANVAIGDFTGDGFNDITLSRVGISGDLRLLTSTAPNTFADSLIDNFGSTHAPVVGDLNQDGASDIIISRASDGQLFREQQDGGGSFTFSSLGTFGAGEHSLAIGHLDDTTVAVVNDIVIGRASGDVRVQFQTGVGTFSDVVVTNLGSAVGHVGVGNLDGAAGLDILAIRADSAVFRESQTGSQTFAETNILNFGPAAVNAMDIGDLDNDGTDDIVIALDDGRVFLNYQETAGIFTSLLLPGTFVGGVPVLDVAIGDLDSDGLQDFVLGLNDGRAFGYFQLVQDADFDSDGDVDGADFLTWQRGFNAAGTLATGDANSDLFVDAADLAIWESQYGSTHPVILAAAVPEPRALILASLGGIFCLAIRRSSILSV